VKPTNIYECNKFMNIEYLGGNLSNCQSLSYLGNGFIYYGSMHGDSFILQLNQERVGEHGYYSIIRTFPSLGEIKHMQMKQSDSTNNQSELIVAGGNGKTSHISVLKRGISLKNVHTIRDLPLIADNGIFTLEDKIFIKFYGLDSLVVL
jgi:DNA damage-binding protein 1